MWRISAPGNAAGLTIIFELVVAALAESPSAASKSGLAIIAPPTPIKPIVLPTVTPSSRSKYALLLFN